MKRLMIINWHWKISNKNTPVKIEITDEKILFLSNYDKNNIDNFNTFISGLIQSINPNEALVLSHNNPGPSDISIPIENITLISKENFLMKVREFKGGEGLIYHGDLNPLGMIDTVENLNSYDKQIKKENFEFVWDYYWNKLDLDYQKKNLINLWLPLSIDIQGLSEVDENKRNQYLNEVLAELKKTQNGKTYAKYLNEGWNEIKKILLPESEGKEVLDSKYRLTEEEKKKVKFPIENIDSNSLEEFIKENFKDSNNPNFLPNWLQEVVKILDEKIKQNK